MAPEHQESATPTINPRKFPVKIVASIGIALVLVIIAGIVIPNYLQRRALNQKLVEAMGKDRGLTETILKIETDSKHVTYAELFELCGKSVEARTNLIVELRGLNPQIDSTLREHLIEYLTQENEFVRLKRAFYRQSLDLSGAFENYEEAARNFAAATYGYEIYLRQKFDYRRKVEKVSRELTENADELIKAYDNMSTQETKISGEANRAGLNFTPIFVKYSKDNKKRFEDGKGSAVMYAALVTGR